MEKAGRAVGRQLPSEERDRQRERRPRCGTESAAAGRGRPGPRTTDGSEQRADGLGADGEAPGKAGGEGRSRRGESMAAELGPGQVE